MDTISVDLTPSVAYALLARAGFTKDERERWTHEDGRWAWQADEALRWALVDMAEARDNVVTIRRTGYTIVYEHTELKVTLAEVTRFRHKWHTSLYNPCPDGSGRLDDCDYAEWNDRASAIRTASNHARDLASAI
jgi:hypothetical protein